MERNTSSAARSNHPGDVLLLVDQQDGWFGRIQEPEQTQHHLFSLARGAQLLGAPTVLTIKIAADFNGPQVHALTTIFNEVVMFDRTVIKAWQDPRVHEAIRRSGRQKVIIAGTGFERCATLPALSSVADSYDTYVVFDASGRIAPLPVTAITRLTQAGIKLVNAGPRIVEMMAVNIHPKASEIYAALA